MIKSILLSTAAVLAVSCAPDSDADGSAKSGSAPTHGAEADSPEASESARLNAWFDEKYDAELDRSPMAKTARGVIDEDYGKWADNSPEFEEARYKRSQDALTEMKTNFDYDKLDAQTKLSWRLFENMKERERSSYKYREYTYTFNQIFGQQTQAPTFLISQHHVSEPAHAEAYISRLEGMGDYLLQALENEKRRFAMGIYPPAFVYDSVLQSIDTLLSGAPFDESAMHSALWDDFVTKTNALDIPEASKEELKARARAALVDIVKPAYSEIREVIEAERAEAGDDQGAWKLPDGEGYYAYRLENMTTTTLLPEEIHQIGLAETARIVGEMRALAHKVGFNGTLKEFVASLSEMPEMGYPDTEEGKAAYLADATAIIDNIRSRLDELFITKPKAQIEVRAVEAFREKSAAGAFYAPGAVDGSRPGVFYVNLGDMRGVSKYSMEALAYHEGIPGHHMQISIAQELEGVPKFRKTAQYTAYHEGWALYAEQPPKEIGLYSDPYSDFGRLRMELLRAVRLVVDTGIHYKHWTVDDALAWMEENTPNSGGRGGLERYVVMPGQATAYMIGMLKIKELRDRAEDVLGEEFDLREFHDVILRNGPVPLSILEELVNDWIEEKKAS